MSDWLSVKQKPSTSSSGISWQVQPRTDKLWPTYHRGKLIVRSSDQSIADQSIDVTLNLQPSSTTTWLFDEPEDASARLQLQDQSLNGFDLTLGPSGKIVSGRWGRALCPGSGRAGFATVRRCVDSTHLNLGDSDWSFEGWFKTAKPAKPRDVLFEAHENVAVGPYPRLRGMGQRTALVVGDQPGQLVFINEPGGIDGLALATASSVFDGSSDAWFHLAVAYDAEHHELGHWINGKLMSRVELQPIRRLRATGENTFAIGSAISGEHAWQGLIDEVQVSAQCRNFQDFEPPTSIAQREKAIVLRPGPHLFFDDHLVAETRNVDHVLHPAEHPVTPPDGWDKFIEQLSNGGDVHLVDLGSRATDSRRRYLIEPCVENELSPV